MEINHTPVNHKVEKQSNLGKNFSALLHVANLERTKIKQNEQIKKLAQSIEPEKKEQVKELYSMILQAKNIDMLNKNNLDFKVNFFKNTMLAHLSAELLTHGMSQEEQDVFYTSYLEMQDKNNHISIPHEKIKELATKEPYEKILYIQSELLTQDIPNHKKNVIKNLVTQFYNKNKSFIDNKFMYELRNMTADKKINAIAKDLTISHQSIQAQSKSDSSKETNRLIS